MSLPHSTSPAPPGASKPVVITEADLVFYCPHCQGELVVDRAGMGLEVTCPHCRQALIVPAEKPASPPPEAIRVETPPAEPAAAAEPTFDFGGKTPEEITQRQAELSHQLKENQSQDTEMRGHINRATIDLHRLQLRLKKLQARQAVITAELTALRGWAAGDH